MYKLLINKKDTNGKDNWLQADLGDDKPAMTYQANNIAELADRQANYSQALKLPFTAQNKLIFGFADQLHVTTDVPYRRWDCRLYSNDYLLAGEGSFLILDKVTESFECQILSGSAGFFTTLKERRMEELDLGYIFQNDFSMDPSLFEKGNYTYAIGMFTKGETDIVNYKMTTKNSFPFIYLNHIFKEMVTQNGYQLITNLENYPGWKTKALPITDIKSTTVTPQNIKSQLEGAAMLKGSKDENENQIYLQRIKPAMGMLQMNGSPEDRFDTNKGYAMEYTCMAEGNLNVYIKIICGERKDINNLKKYNKLFDNPDKEFGGLDYEDKNLSIINDALNYEAMICVGITHNSISLIEFDDRNPTHILKYNNSIKVLPNDTVKIIIDSSYWAPPYEDYLLDIDVKFSYETIKEESLQSVSAYTWSFSKNLGFNFQLDFFKAIVQLFGLYIYVDENRKKIYAYTLKQLLTNKKSAVDWSSKTDRTKKELMFRLPGYALKNTISFDANKEEDFTDSGSFEITNIDLEDEKQLFQVKLESGKNYDRDSMQLAYLPILVNKNNNLEPAGSKPRIVDIVPEYKKITNNKVGSHNKEIKYPYASYPSMQEFINTYYSLDKTILTDTKVLEAEFNLTDQDMEQFNPFIPVYIEKYGAFFYVNKISNYVSGQLTTCELIRL